MSKCQMDMEATSKEFLLAKSGKMWASKYNVSNKL